MTQRTRDQYLFDMAAYMVDQFGFHPADAEREARIALEEHEEMECAFGDPQLTWTKDDAHQHAFHWIDDVRRQKYWGQ